MEGVRTRTNLFSTTSILLLLVLLISISTVEMGPKMAEARTCESASHRFKGICIRKSNCGAVCQTEGFHWGKCRGFRARCMCTKTCREDEQN